MDDKVYFTKCSRKPNPTADQEPNWRLCITTEEEKQRVLSECYISEDGQHLGRDRTIARVSSKYYWKPNLTGDVREYVADCEQCQILRNHGEFICMRLHVYIVLVQQHIFIQGRLNVNSCADQCSGQQHATEFQ